MVRYIHKHWLILIFLSFSIEKTEVTIVPGVTTGELMEFFLKNGVCFESDVILMNVTYGGVQTTGCHVSTIKD